jgi:hypothetical protein
MLAHLVYQAASLLPARYCPARWLHRRGLDAYAAGEPAAAERWFEAAALRYREELEVEPLARVRVHQLMARARAAASAGAESAAMMEIVRRLNRLDRLERLEAPHELADARVVLADWIEPGVVPGSVPDPLSAAQAA